MTIELIEDKTAPVEPVESKLMKFLGGRKFILAYSALIAGTTLCAFGRIDGVTYSGIVLATLALYNGANVLQKKFLVEATPVSTP